MNRMTTRHVVVHPEKTNTVLPAKTDREKGTNKPEPDGDAKKPEHAGTDPLPYVWTM